MISIFCQPGWLTCIEVILIVRKFENWGGNLYSGCVLVVFFFFLSVFHAKSIVPTYNNGNGSAKISY